MRVRDLDPREKRFVSVALRRRALRSRYAKAFSLAAVACFGIATLGYIDSPYSSEAPIALLVGAIALIGCAVSLITDGRKSRRDAMLALDRCGCCGHTLRGTDRAVTEQINARTCCECGTVWTDLDRHDSLSMIYDCG